MQPHTTDITALPRRYRTWLPLTGLTPHHSDGPPAAVLIHLRANLTTRALAALFNTSQSTVDRVLHHLVPVLAW